MQKITLGETGAGATSTLNMTVQPVVWGGASTRGKTLFVKLGGTAFATCVLEGSVNGTDYLTCVDIFGTAVPDLVSNAPRVIVIGADYSAIRIRATGGDVDSTISADLLG